MGTGSRMLCVRPEVVQDVGCQSPFPDSLSVVVSADAVYYSGHPHFCLALYCPNWTEPRYLAGEPGPVDDFDDQCQLSEIDRLFSS